MAQTNKKAFRPKALVIGVPNFPLMHSNDSGVLCWGPNELVENRPVPSSIERVLIWKDQDNLARIMEEIAELRKGGKKIEVNSDIANMEFLSDALRPYWTGEPWVSSSASSGEDYGGPSGRVIGPVEEYKVVWPPPNMSGMNHPRPWEEQKPPEPLVSFLSFSDERASAKPLGREQKKTPRKRRQSPEVRKVDRALLKLSKDATKLGVNGARTAAEKQRHQEEIQLLTSVAIMLAETTNVRIPARLKVEALPRTFQLVRKALTRAEKPLVRRVHNDLRL